MRVVVAGTLVAASCLAQQAAVSKSLERQRASVERQRATLTAPSAPTSAGKQRAAARRQVLGSASADGASGFFTIPWPDPPNLPPTNVGSLLPCRPLDTQELFHVTGRAAATNGIAQEILQAVIQQESAGRPCAVSTKGALGLMQLMPGTAEELGVDNALDPESNVLAGSRFLKNLLDRYSGDLSLALAAYNAGPKRVDRAGGVPGIPETKDYVRSVLQRIRLDAPTISEIPPVTPLPSSAPRDVRSEQR